MMRKRDNLQLLNLLLWSPNWKKCHLLNLNHNRNLNLLTHNMPNNPLSNKNLLNRTNNHNRLQISSPRNQKYHNLKLPMNKKKQWEKNYNNRNNTSIGPNSMMKKENDKKKKERNTMKKWEESRTKNKRENSSKINKKSKRKTLKSEKNFKKSKRSKIKLITKHHYTSKLVFQLPHHLLSVVLLGLHSKTNNLLLWEVWEVWLWRSLCKNEIETSFMMIYHKD